jgi:hypothetical protein
MEPEAALVPVFLLLLPIHHEDVFAALDADFERVELREFKLLLNRLLVPVVLVCLIKYLLYDERDERRCLVRLLHERLAGLAALLKDTDKRVENWLEIAERGFNFAEKAAAIFAEAKENDDIETRKEIFASLGSDLILKDKILSIDWDNLLFPIQTMAKEVRAVHAELEPVENPVNTTDYSELYSQNPILLRG